MKRFLVFILLSVALSNKVYCQSDTKLGSWYIYNGSFYIDPRVELFFETQMRLYQVFTNRQEFFLRPMANYYFTPNLFAGAGYSFGMTWNYTTGEEEKVRETENRLILQAGLNHSIERVRLQHRYRFEQRWIEEDYRHRFRYRIQVTVPVNRSTMEMGALFINFYDEIFIDSRPELAFDQNRIYIAGGCQISRTLNIQLGYLFQSRSADNFNRIQLFLTQRLDFYK